MYMAKINLPLRFWTGGLKCPYSLLKSIPNTENGKDTKNMYQINFDMFVFLYFIFFVSLLHTPAEFFFVFDFSRFDWIHTTIDFVPVLSFRFLFPSWNTKKRNCFIVNLVNASWKSFFSFYQTKLFLCPFFNYV